MGTIMFTPPEEVRKGRKRVYRALTFYAVLVATDVGYWFLAAHHGVLPGTWVDYTFIIVAGLAMSTTCFMEFKITNMKEELYSKRFIVSQLEETLSDLEKKHAQLEKEDGG